jgi:hypothetical protein
MADETNSQSDPKTKLPKVGIFRKVFHHPNFNAVAGVFGIAGVLFGVFTYVDAKKEPDLTYYISPTRTPIVQRGTLNIFTVMFHDREITNDLSSVEIQIWNRGKQAIRGGDILNGGDVEKPITVRAQNNEAIYKVSGSFTRDVIGLRLVTNSIPQTGVIPLDWRILERGDAIRLQIIHAGNVSVPFVVDGAIAGQQKGISQFRASTSPHSKIYLLFACLYLFFIIVLLYFRRSKRDKMDKRVDMAFILVMIIMSIISSYQYFSTMTIPPFGF